ncbi:MAG TPA: hypothetical protein VF137_05310 [Candidatus Dormibacteraeota bacterium]
MGKRARRIEPDVDDAVEMAAFTAHTIGSSEAATFVVATDGTIVSWSEGAERLFRRPAWNAVGKRCHEVLAGVHVVRDPSPGALRY